ncbi:MAG: DUF368 domain-containing protein [Oscillospiraceae bacterium]|nr:DUF368 domain-containing protein [Oscillospiraceae bacterium]
MFKDIKNLFNGSVYGMTLVIPGVSATILAIILGFYDELLHTMNHFKENKRQNARYLILFLIGIAVGTVLFSRLITFFINSFSLPTMLFFAGLLAGIIPLTYTYAKGGAKKIAPREVVLAIAAMALLYLLSTGFSTPDINPTGTYGSINTMVIVFLLVAGVINGASLVIPGLSGAFILLIMGLYPLIVSTVSNIGSYLVDPRNLDLLFEIAVILAPFGIGALIGVLFMARIMEKLLRDYHKSVYAVILGLIVASLVTLFQNPIVYQSGTSAPAIIIGAILCAVGFIIAFLLGKKAK